MFGGGVLFYVCSWFLPVSITQAFLQTETMILTGIAAIFIKKCSPELPFAIIICSLGCIFLSQPEFIFSRSKSNLNLTNTVNGIMENVTIDQEGTTLISAEDYFITKTTQLNTISQPMSTFNYTEMVADLNISSTTASFDKSTIQDININFNQSQEAKVEYDQPLYGYICVTGIAICFWIHLQFNVEYLLQITTMSTILFWTGIGGITLSIAIMFITENPILITVTFDVIMIILLAFATALNIIFINYSVMLIPFSRVALVLPTSLIYLYVFQKTFLKEIQPGADNWMEILG